MRRLRAIVIAVLLPAGCATIPPRLEIVPVPCVTDPATVGRWSDARMTLRITLQARYEARGGVATFFQTSRNWRCPYRLVAGRLELQEAADERNTYSRR